MKDKIIAKKDELIEELGHTLQLIYNEIEGKKIISKTCDKELRIIASRIKTIMEEMSELQSLESQEIE